MGQLRGGDGGSRQGGRNPLVVVFVTVFIDLLGFGIIIPILPFYADLYGATPFSIGLLFAIYSLMQFFFAPLWGRASDRIGRRPILLISLLGTSGAFLIFGLAQSLPMLFAGRIAAGIFGAVIPTAYAYIADVTPRHNRVQGMGLIGAAFGLGFIFGPFIGGVMAHQWGYAAPAFFASGLAGANLLLAWFVFPESFPPQARMAARQQRNSTHRSASLVRIWHALRHPRVGGLIFLFFLVTFAFANMEATLALLTRDLLNWGARENGFLFGYIGVIMVIVQGGLIRPLSRRFGEPRLVIAGTVMLVPALGLLPFSPHLSTLLLLCALMAVGSGITSPSINSLISQGVEADEQGRIFGLGQSMGSLARVVGPVWGGLVYHTIGPAAPYTTAALLMAGSSVVAVVVMRGLKRAEENPSPFRSSVEAETGRGA